MDVVALTHAARSLVALGRELAPIAAGLGLPQKLGLQTIGWVAPVAATSRLTLGLMFGAGLASGAAATVLLSPGPRRFILSQAARVTESVARSFQRAGERAEAFKIPPAPVPGAELGR